MRPDCFSVQTSNTDHVDGIKSVQAFHETPLQENGRKILKFLKVKDADATTIFQQSKSKVKNLTI